MVAAIYVEARSRFYGCDTASLRAAYVPRYGFIWIWSRRKIIFLCRALPLHKNRKALTSSFLGSGSDSELSACCAHLSQSTNC